MKEVEGCIFDLDNVLVDSKNSTILPGVKRFLINLRVSGMKLAVASKKSNADVLNVLNIKDFFDVVLDSEDKTANSTPILLKTASELGLAPENCVIFDNSTDILDQAKKLNMSSIGVGVNIPCNSADKTIPNLSNVNSSILNFS